MSAPITPLWLSHHRPEHYHRCLGLGGWKVCARCAGLYPVMFSLIAVQLALRLDRPREEDLALLVLGSIPALVDWARGRLRPESGTNLSRVLTGAILGAVLARGLFLHFVRPFNPISSIQFGFLALVFLLVEALAFWRRRTDRNSSPGV